MKCFGSKTLQKIRIKSSLSIITQTEQAITCTSQGIRGRLVKLVASAAIKSISLSASMLICGIIQHISMIVPAFQFI
jgi:hypothetical protein